jgi:hypothetical protein
MTNPNNDTGFDNNFLKKDPVFRMGGFIGGHLII